MSVSSHRKNDTGGKLNVTFHCKPGILSDLDEDCWTKITGLLTGSLDGFVFIAVASVMQQ